MLAVLWDLDGVLADNSHAMNGKNAYHHLTEDEWREFYTMLPDCALIEGHAALMQMLSDQGYHNIVFTNRPESQREMTTLWLKQNELPYDFISMRTDGRLHGGSKAERLPEVMQRFIVVLAIDDDPEACVAYQAAGIPTIYAHSGYHRNPA
jgi:phosphoglycolate phosphatase-like HAD superfamily hydrolase